MRTATAFTGWGTTHASPVPPLPAPEGGYVTICGLIATDVTSRPWSAATPDACMACLGQLHRAGAIP